MRYLHHYTSPLGELLLAADEQGLTGLWFTGQKYYPAALEGTPESAHSPVFANAVRWLDLYFSGANPDFDVALHLTGTRFQLAVWEILRSIPYGDTITYGEIARRLAAQTGQLRLSARAVGGAVGRNPISILVPCHRVVGASGSLTGYAGGIDRKIALLTLEGIDTSPFFIPPHSAAP